MILRRTLAPKIVVTKSVIESDHLSVYALGLAFGEMLTGTRSFASAAVVSLPPGMRPEVTRVVSTALARDPYASYQSLAEFVEDLASYRRENPS
jgi:hypothetical protein